MGKPTAPTKPTKPTNPTVTLTGSAGFESFDVQHALDWQQRIWSIGPSVSVPIFEGGRLKAACDDGAHRWRSRLTNTTPNPDHSNVAQNAHRQASVSERRLISMPDFLDLLRQRGVDGPVPRADCGGPAAQDVRPAGNDRTWD